jgi:hypothetical protein
MTARRLALLLGAALAALPGAAHAYFDDVATGARGIALGAAAGATVTDPSAYYWNPAALATMPRTELLLDYARPYGVPDLNVGTLAASTRRYGTGWALAWHRYSISSVYAEDQFCAAAGRRLFETRRGFALDGGATFKLGRIGFQPFDDPSGSGAIDLGHQTKGAFDVAGRLTTPWRIDFSGVVRDVNQPRYRFVEGSGGDLQKARLELASALRWNRESTIMLGWSQDKAGPASLAAGIEITFFDVFAVRSSVTNLARITESYGKPTELGYNAGFGVYHHGWFVDAVATTTHDLGASYRVSLRLPVAGGAGAR